MAFVELWIDGETLHSRHDLPEDTPFPDVAILGEYVYVRKGQTCEYRKGVALDIGKLPKPEADSPVKKRRKK